MEDWKNDQVNTFNNPDDRAEVVPPMVTVVVEPEQAAPVVVVEEAPIEEAAGFNFEDEEEEWDWGDEWRIWVRKKYQDFSKSITTERVYDTVEIENL